MKGHGAYIWNIIGNIGPQLIYLLVTMILARYLTPEDFGKIGVLAVFISIATTLNDAGLSGSLIRESKITNLDCSTINLFNIGVSSILYILLFLCAPYIEHFFNVPGLKGVARSLCLVFLINSFSTVPKAIMVRTLRFKSLSLITFVSIGIASIVAIIAAAHNYGAYSIVFYQLTNAVITSMCIIILAKYRFSIHFSLKSFKKLFSFGFFTTLTNILDNVYENMLTFLFGKFLNVNQAGYLSQAKKLEDASISACKNTVGSVAFPILTRMREDRDTFWKEALSITKNIILLVLPCLLTVSIYSNNIIVLVFGKNWISAGPYLSAVMIAGFFMLIESAVRTFIKSMGNVARLAEYTLIKRVICIVIILSAALLNPKLIIPAYIIGSAIGLFVNIVLYCKIIGRAIWQFVHELCKYSLPSLICCCFCWICYNTFMSFRMSILTTAVVGIIYLVVLLPKFGLNLFYLLKHHR